MKLVCDILCGGHIMLLSIYNVISRVCVLVFWALLIYFFQGRCCNVTTCRYKEAGEECMPETECSQAARCSGNTSQCPAQPHKRNFLECNKDSNLCMNGTCSLSVCVKLGLEACFCSEKESQCKICCLYEGKCQAAKDIAKVRSTFFMF